MKKIIYADDEEMNLAIVEAYLTDQFDLRLINSGTACLEQLETEIPDLLLLDHMMPDLDGLEVLKRLRAEDKTRRLKVVIVSANAYNEDRQQALKLGADDYLVKPFDEQQLLDTISRNLS